MNKSIDIVGRGRGSKDNIAFPKKILTLVAPALICGALLAFAPAVKADGALTLGAVNSALAGQSDAYSALLDFAQMVGADQPKIEVAAKKAAPAPKIVSKGGVGDAYMVGSAKCMTCHAASAAEFNLTLMGRIGRTTQKGAFECENCHGPGSAHVSAGGGRGVGGINGFRSDDPQQIAANNGLCLACHEKGARTAWQGSVHEERGLACTTCHTVMRNVTPKRNLKTTVEFDTCFQCHKLQRAQIQRSSHMPVREGKITCSNCHNPHGSVYGTEAMLREASINQNCYKCHAEKRGPLMWEHAPVRENCINCHEAHGSNNEYLLKVSRPRLCNECHSAAHNSIIQVGHSCNNCHSQVHGSNDPSGRFFTR